MSKLHFLRSIDNFDLQMMQMNRSFDCMDKKKVQLYLPIFTLFEFKQVINYKYLNAKEIMNKFGYILKFKN